METRSRDGEAQPHPNEYCKSFSAPAGLASPLTQNGRAVCFGVGIGIGVGIAVAIERGADFGTDLDCDPNTDSDPDEADMNRVGPVCFDLAD